MVPRKHWKKMTGLVPAEPKRRQANRIPPASTNSVGTVSWVYVVVIGPAHQVPARAVYRTNW
jgi:hypothetical protein